MKSVGLHCLGKKGPYLLALVGSKMGGLKLESSTNLNLNHRIMEEEAE